MNRDLLSKAVGGIDDRYIAEALASVPDAASEGLAEVYLR